MKVRISFCTVCLGYRARAEALAQELRVRFGADVAVVEGKLGQFDVTADGQLVASRGETLLSRLRPVRPPKNAAVIEAIERHLQPREGERCDVPSARVASGVSGVCVARSRGRRPSAR
jgi:hypothetical protein